MRPITDRLLREGLDVRIGCTPGPYTPWLEERGYQMAALPITRGLNPLSLIGSIWRVWRYLRRERIDILHVHTPIAGLVGRVAAFLARTPIVFYTAHGFYFHDEMSPTKRRLHIAMERFAGLFTGFTFTCSDEDRRTAIDEHIIRPDRVKTILNGIDLKRFAPSRFNDANRASAREELGVPLDAPLVAISGRLVREKGYFEFFEAAAIVLDEIPAARFLVLGDALTDEHDDSKTALRGHVQRLQIEHAVTFAGMRDDMPVMLFAADIFLLPSYREGMPYSILEAMAMGLPVIATDIRGSREEIVDGETGYLVPTRDARALGDRTLDLLNDDGLRRRMGEAGRQRVETTFEESITVDRQWEEYRRLIGERFGSEALTA